MLIIASRATVTTVVVAALLAGCGNDPALPESPSPASSPTAAAESGTTVAQYASVIAPYDREWRDQVDTTDDQCADIETLPTCGLGYLTLSTRAEIVQVVLSGVRDNPEHPDYLGEPPAEIASLVNRTLEAAAAVPPTVEAWTEAGCSDPLDSACAAESLIMHGAVSDMTAAFDSWRPYM